MRLFTSRLHCVLRAVTIALLLLGLVSSPVLAYAADLHDLEHASAALAAGAEEHVEREPSLLDSDDADDRTGEVWHGLIHIAHAHGASTEASYVRMIVAVQQTDAVVFPPTAPLTPLQHIAGPFRPPIA